MVNDMAKFDVGRRKKCQQNLEILQDLVDACDNVGQDVTSEKVMLSKAEDMLKKNEYSTVESMITNMNESLGHKTKISIIRESVTGLAKFRSLCDIADKLGMLDDKERQLLESMTGERCLVFSLEDWKSMYTKCDNGIMKVKTVLEKEFRDRMEEISGAIRMGENLEMDMMDVDILLELAQEELDRDEFLACYNFLSQAMAVNKNVLQIFIKYAAELRKAQEKLAEFRVGGSNIDISQLEQLVALSQETAKRGDYSGAFQVAMNLGDHIRKLRESTNARERISNMRLRLLDLKDICPDHLDKRKFFSRLDEAVLRAKSEYNNEEYPAVLAILDDVTDELENVDARVRREHCVSLLNRCQELINEMNNEASADSMRTIKLTETLDYAYDLFTAERYGEAGMKAEQCYGRIRSIMKGEGKKFCEEHSDNIDELLKGLRSHRMDTPELDELYEKFKHYRYEGDYVASKPLIGEIEEKVHVRYRNFINKKLESVKDQIELATDLGEEIDEITSGLIIVQENFDNHNYEKALEILEKVAGKVQLKHSEAMSIKGSLRKRLDSTNDTLAEMTGRGEDVEGLFKAIENIEAFMEAGNIVKARRVADKLDAAIFGIIDNLFLNIDVLRSEIEDMGLETSSMFDNLAAGRRSLARDQYMEAFTIAMDIKTAIKELEKRLTESPIGSETKGEGLSGGGAAEEESAEIPKEVSLVPLQSRDDDGMLRVTEELLDISKGMRPPSVIEDHDDAGRTIGIPGGGRLSLSDSHEDAPDIVELATKAKEQLDALTAKGMDVTYLERDIEIAMSYVEKDDWDNAHKHLEHCIRTAGEALREDGESGNDESITAMINEQYKDIAKHETRGIKLGETREMLDEAMDSANEGDIGKAREYLNGSKSHMDKRVSTYDKLAGEISHIQNKLYKLVQENVDVGIAQSIFDKIKNLTREGKYAEAMDLCEQCRDDLSRRETYAL